MNGTLTIDGRLLYRHPDVEIPNHEIIELVRTWVGERAPFAVTADWFDANAVVRAGDPDTAEVMQIICEGIYEWPDHATGDESTLRVLLNGRGVHLEATNGYTLGVYRWEPVVIPTSTMHREELRAAMGFEPEGIVGAAREVVAAIDDLAEFSASGRVFSAVASLRRALDSDEGDGVMRDGTLVRTYPVDADVETTLVVQLTDEGITMDLNVGGEVVVSTADTAQDTADNLIAGRLPKAANPEGEARDAYLAAEHEATERGHRPQPYTCIGVHPEEGRAHPAWPAKRGVEVGCCNRMCMVCYYLPGEAGAPADPDPDAPDGPDTPPTWAEVEDLVKDRIDALRSDLEGTIGELRADVERIDRKLDAMPEDRSY